MKDRYGKRQIMVDAHYSQMINVPAATVSRVSLRSFYDVKEKHLRSLQALGEDTNQMQILSMMKSKLPRSILADIEQMKNGLLKVSENDSTRRSTNWKQLICQ